MRNCWSGGRISTNTMVKEISDGQGYFLPITITFHEEINEIIRAKPTYGAIDFLP